MNTLDLKLFIFEGLNRRKNGFKIEFGIRMILLIERKMNQNTFFCGLL